jgi:MmyB-like transcription regulator ligand binding domain/Helix-turn-helix domain
MLCGIGVTWYTWLEQGRPINVSSQVLGALSRVLRLDATERAHLFALADFTDPLSVPQPPEVGTAVQAVLDALEPVPAVVVSQHLDLIASNPAYLALTGDYRVLPRTMMLYFCETGWRRVMGTGRTTRRGWWPRCAPRWRRTSPTRADSTCWSY